jgi:uncharacterized protein DUF748
MRWRWRAGGGLGRRWQWVVGVVISILVLGVLVSYLVEEPLRRYIEREVNARLKGYTASIHHLDFHLIGFSWDLEDVVLVQDANPDPPVMKMKELSASIQWWALMFGRVVADFEFDQPVVYIDREHLERESKDDVPVQARGWQDALQAVYPFKLNELVVKNGTFTYVEEGQTRPLALTKINAVAQDIRNVQSKKGVYPSPLHVDAVVFDNGRALIDGHADFMAEPHAGVKGRVDLTKIELDYFTPVLARYNLVVKKGVLTGGGEIEYAPGMKVVDLEKVSVDGLQADYIYRKKTAEVAKEAAKKTAKVAKEVSNDPGVHLKVREVRVSGSTFGFVNKDGRPEYRVFLADADITLRNFSNQRTEGEAVAVLKGRFMGSGDTAVKAVLRPEVKGPDFEIDARIENTDMKAMNDLLRAHGNLDVVSGVFSVYTEINVKNGRVNGYVKPIFRDLDVFDRTQDANKKFGQKLKERAVDVAAKVFKNRKRDEVATVADIAGPVEDPKANTFQVVINLVRNAFVKAILPGFESSARSARSARNR